jgi:hypothetical protein
VHTDLDALVLENHLLLKSEQTPAPTERGRYLRQFALD